MDRIRKVRTEDGYLTGEIFSSFFNQYIEEYVIRGDEVLYVSGFGAAFYPWGDFSKIMYGYYAVKTDSWPHQGRLF